MAIRILAYEPEAPTTSYPEYERILELRFHHDEGTNPPTYAIVDLDMDKNLPDDLDDEIMWQLRIHMGRADARRYAGYEDVTEYLNDRAKTYSWGELIYTVETTLGDFVDDFDVEGIAHEISYTKNGELMADIEREDYWDIVRRYDRANLTEPSRS